MSGKWGNATIIRREKRYFYGFLFSSCFFSLEAVTKCIEQSWSKGHPRIEKRSRLGELLARSGVSRRGTSSVILALLLMAGQCGAQTAHQSSPLEFDIEIPALNAAEALNLLAEQTDSIFLFPYEDVRVHSTEAISGRYELLDALATLLEGSGLKGGLSENGAISISLAENVRHEPINERNDNMNTRNGFFAAVLGLLAGAGVTGEAVAQDGPATASQGPTVEEVLVTARRREENLQEVPVAITAMTSEDLELRTIENTEDLQIMLPNVDIRGQGRQGGGAGVFTVRGVGGVARYVDGVALTGNQGGLANVVELERIEVLRGPQGTYFGKNAIGGAIQYVTQKPADEFGARVRGTWGSYDRQDLVLNMDIPLSDTVKTKLTAASLYRGGYVDSVTINQSYGEQDNDILTGMLQWTPADNFDALFTVTSNRENSDMQAYVLFDVVEDFPAGPRTPEAYNDPAVSAFPFTDELYAYGKNEEYLTAADYQGPGVDFESFSASATLTWDINDSMTLKSITGTRDFHYGVWIDSDSTPLGYFNTWAYDEVEEFSQEIQLYGGNDRLDWIVGVYYQDMSQTNVDSNWQRLELTGTGPRSPRVRNTLGTGDVTDTAYFAEGVYQVTDQLSITLGTRYSKEELENKSFTPLPIGPEDMNTPTYSTVGTIRQVAGVDVITNAEFDATTHRIAVQYQVNDDVMVYASQSQGFNGGGVNNIFNPALPNNGIVPYGSELLTNNEVGMRADLFDNKLRLNATAFFGDWEDIQIGETLVPGQNTVTNGGAAEVSGLEVEGQWYINDAFSMDFTFGKLDAHYTDVGASTTINVGTTFANSPETSYSVGFTWDAEVGNGGNLVSRLDYGYISDFETFSDEQFQVALGPNKPYGLVNGRMIYTPPSGDYTVALYGTNLTDEWYRLGGFAAVLAGIDQGVVARPREVGISLSMDF